MIDDAMVDAAGVTGRSTTASLCIYVSISEDGITEVKNETSLMSPSKK
jgi:hypothetical protein